MEESSQYSAEQLLIEQKNTLEGQVLAAGTCLKLGIWMLDLVYGKGRSFLKFKVLEELARVPYWAWEQGGYHAVSRLYLRGLIDEKKREWALHHIAVAREAQDNEQWHLMLIEEVMRKNNVKVGWWKGSWIPALLGFGYLVFSKLLYFIRPKGSFLLNAQFESHAEKEYMLFVQEHPEWESEPFDSWIFQYYPRQKTVANLFRRIALDEREHKNHSLQQASGA